MFKVLKRACWAIVAPISAFVLSRPRCCRRRGLIKLRSDFKHTTPIPSKAYIAIPKKTGKFDHPAKPGSFSVCWMFLMRYWNITTKEMPQQMLAIIESGARVRRSRMKDKRIMGTSIIAIHDWTSRALETWEEVKITCTYCLNGTVKRINLLLKVMMCTTTPTIRILN